MRAHICRGERERDDASIIVFCTRARVGEQRFDDTKVLSGVFGGLYLSACGDIYAGVRGDLIAFACVSVMWRGRYGGISVV